MNIQQLHSYCSNKKGVTEDFPFDNDTLVFKVLGKLFLLVSLKSWESGQASINLKADPDYAEELRAKYESIEPGFHTNKKHWNTMKIYKNELQSKFIFELIDHSYAMVIKNMPKKLRESL